MSIQTTPLAGLNPENVQNLVNRFSDYEKTDNEKIQMRDHIEWLEREVDRQSTIIDALIKAIKVIERG